MEDGKERDYPLTPQSSDSPTEADLNWMRDAVEAATKNGVLTAKERMVVQHHLESTGASWRETAEVLGISANDCAASYSRAIPKIRTWILCNHRDVMGGTVALAVAAAKARRAESSPLSDFEYEVFGARILKANSTYHRAGWRTALRAACGKVLRSLEFSPRRGSTP